MTFYRPSDRYTFISTSVEPARNRQRSSGYTLYTVRAGDTLESIALVRLGSTTRYWELADLNPQVKFPLDVVVGDVIRVPT